ncbi:MAG: DUF3309 family protein [Reyranella sp.]
MLALSLTVLLAAAGIAAFPCWRHSAGWGYGPSTVAGGLLFLVAAFTIGDRAAPHSQSAAPERAPSFRVHSVVAQMQP